MAGGLKTSKRVNSGFVSTVTALRVLLNAGHSSTRLKSSEFKLMNQCLRKLHALLRLR